MDGSRATTTNPAASSDRNKGGGGVGRILKVCVSPATGGQIELAVNEKETVSGLKWTLSRKLKIPPERITLLFKDRPLRDGNLAENQVLDNSRILLLPNMESGMTFHRPDVGVIQALENLSDSQVNDFLSGRAPLLLAMRLGDHMMFVQLQLSTSSCSVRHPKKPASAAASSAESKDKPPQTMPGSVLNPSALAELGQSLSQKLREFSRLTTVPHQKVAGKSNPPVTSVPAATQTTSAQAPGAVIESMHHIGQGVYSGTFSGTLDPSLQDLNGKPKRNVSTIIHILNDLLRAQQFCRDRQTPSAAFFNINDLHAQQPCNAADENSALRGKVRHLQMMMEERKLRRKARRETKAPYHWSSPKGNFDISAYEDEPSVNSSMEHVPLEVSEPAYANPNLEQESVFV